MFEEYSALVFCLCMLALLFSLPRLPHMVVGILLGIIAVLLVPKTIWTEGEQILEGRIISTGFEHGQLRIDLDGLRMEGKSYRGRARLNVYQSTSSEPFGALTDLADFNRGRLIKTRVVLKPPRPLGNEGEFDYARHLRSQGITMCGYIKGMDPLVIGTDNQREINRFRNITNCAADILNKLARPEAEVLKAMLWGDRSYLTYAAQDSFATLGLSHLIAISGLHMGIIVLFGYVIIYTVLRCLPRLAERVDTPMLAKMAGLICAVLFAAIIKTSYPTTRAVAMAVIVITALIFARRTALLDALALSGCFILLIWPLSLFTPGFLLSFAAVLGLVMVLERMRDAQVWKQILAVPIVAAAFTMPMAVYIFGFVAPLGIIFNVIFVPLFSFLALPLGLLGLLSASISDAASLALFAWAMNLISLIVWTGEHFGRLVPVPRPNVVWVYLIYLGLIISFLGSLRQSDNAMEMHIRRLLLWCICLALIIMPVGQHYYQHSRPLMFDFISVGQGDSILITKGSHAVLIDAGGTRKGFDTGRFVVGPHLLRRGITRLDLAVLTHSHPDHAGGMPFILERFDADQVWTNIVNDRGFDDVTRITSLKSIPVLAVQRGERLLLDDIKIEVLHPQVRHVKSSELDLNLHSVVLMIGDAHMSGLFMADAHRFGEMTVIHGDTEMRADVLKVAHHGSAGSCQNIFLDNVKARLAVIMCGYHNYYGMPDPDVLERLQVRGVDIYRTDRNGEVQIISNHARIGVKSILCPAEKQ